MKAKARLFSPENRPSLPVPDDAEETRNSLLSITLSAAVPLRMAEYRRRGSPDAMDVERVRRFAEDLGSYGDRLLYRHKGKTGGEYGPSTAEMFNRLADAIAVLSFFPGGVYVLGLKYKSHPPRGGYLSPVQRLWAKTKRK